MALIIRYRKEMSLLREQVERTAVGMVDDEDEDFEAGGATSDDVTG